MVHESYPPAGASADHSTLRPRQKHARHRHVFRVLRSGGETGATAVPGTRHAPAANPFMRAQNAADPGAPRPAGETGNRATRCHAGRVGPTPGPAFWNLDGGSVAAPVGVEL